MGKIAFLFAGQGAQKPGMGRDIYRESAAARAVMDGAERIRPGTLNQCFEGPAEALTQTINAQPCLFAVDLACAAAAAEAGLYADCAAGFSLGEMAAAVFAGMLDFERGMRLTIRRAELMHACAQAHPGAMAAVLKLSGAKVEALCAPFSDVWPVNYNSPEQTVVSMAPERMDAFAAVVRAAGGRAVRLNVGGAFHSPYMDEAARAFHALLLDAPLSQPSMPIYANATAQPYAGDYEATLARQIALPVRWQKSLENMLSDGVDTFIELGAGTTLTGLTARIAPEARAAHIERPEDLAACRALLGGVL